jgi:hypothetical protein
VTGRDERVAPPAKGACGVQLYLTDYDLYEPFHCQRPVAHGGPHRAAGTNASIPNHLGVTGQRWSVSWKDRD